MQNITRPLSAEELSLILGISEFTIKKLARSGELPCVFINRRPRFDLESLLAYFEKLEGVSA
jgi:excisionase family DNA binding protein